MPFQWSEWLLPSIRTAPHMSTSSPQWIVSGYTLGYGGLLLPGGRAADLLGRRRVFVAAALTTIPAVYLASFTLTSLFARTPLGTPASAGSNHTCYAPWTRSGSVRVVPFGHDCELGG